MSSRADKAQVALGRVIRRLRAEGAPPKQAVAAALAVSSKSKPRKSGRKSKR